MKAIESYRKLAESYCVTGPIITAVLPASVDMRHASQLSRNAKHRERAGCEKQNGSRVTVHTVIFRQVIFNFIIPSAK